MSSEVLNVKSTGRAALLTIDRPDAGNSISSEVTTALNEALDALDGDHELAAIVITGAGDKFFSSGGDIKQYRSLVTRDQLQSAFDRPRRLLDRLEVFPVPVIAAVNGIAMGGGAELMLACDMCLAAPTATFGFPFVHMGLIPGWYGTERLTRICGYTNAMYLLATGDPVDAKEARRLGLVYGICEDTPVVDAALVLAEKLARAAPLSLAATKRTLLSGYHLPRDQVRRQIEHDFADLWLSDDHREAEAAFVDKRPPTFKGK